MEDRLKQCIEMLREGACCSVCVNAFTSVYWPYPCEERTATNNNMDEAANIIESLVVQLESAQPKWISVEDELPPVGERVLALNGHSVFESFIDCQDVWHRSPTCYELKGNVTHWMPLPSGPKEE